jgi:DNA-binding transcriptional LysR family regulator
MDRIEAMKVFTQVVDMGSFAKVAKQLNVARSVVTRQITALEAHLGTKLLARSTRRLTLTSSGAIYLEKCREILNLVESAETDLSEEKGIPRGPIHISLPLTYGVTRLAPLLLNFAAQHPQVTLSMDFSDRRANLVEEGLDLTIRITRQLAPTDIVKKLGGCKLIAVASPKYLNKHGTPSTPDDLKFHQCLGYSLDFNTSGWTFEIDNELQTIYVPFSLNSNNGPVLAEAAVAGMGIAVLPDFMIEQQISNQTLQPILTTFATPEAGIYAMLPSNRLIPYRVRALLDYLAREIASGNSA